MKQRTLSLIMLATMIVGTVAAADPPVIFPPVPQPPAPTPSANVSLPAGQLLVFRSNKTCIIVVSPKGLADVRVLPGPVTLGGIFVGGSGTFEVKTFTEKSVYVATAASKGIGELIVVPTDAIDESGIVRKGLDVDGAAPKPPDPPQPLDPLAQSFQTAYTTAPDARALQYLTTCYQVLSKQVATKAPKTNTEAVAWLKSVIDNKDVGFGSPFITDTALAPLRRVIADYLTPTFGTVGNTPIDTAKLAAELSKVADALARVK